MKPSASAPSPTASKASASEVIPQILTTGVALIGRGAGAARRPTGCPTIAFTRRRGGPGDRTKVSPTSTAW